MPCAVINVLHPMMGVDIHQELTPPGAPPIPVPVPIPHAVVAPLGNVPGALAKTVKRSDTSEGKKGVYVNFVKMPIILQGSDIGPIIPHIPLAPCTPIPLLPIIILTSGSVSEYFAFSVKAHGKPVANAPLVFFTYNMNCGFPCAMPLNVVFAPSLVFTGFRIGDVLAGVVGSLMDAALSFAINTAFNGLGMKGDGGLLGLITARMGGPVIKNALTSGFTAILGSFGGLGSPIGYSNEDTTVIGHYWGNAKGYVQERVASTTRRATTAIMDYFNIPD
jgi:hypothetical protein